MQLFNEYKNIYFKLVMEIINESIDGINENDIIKMVNQVESDEKLLNKNQNTFDELILNKTNTEDDLNLLEIKEGIFEPIVKLENPIPVRFSKMEKMWLKAFVKDLNVRTVLPEKLLNKLEKTLKDVDTCIKTDYIETTNIIEKNEYIDLSEVRNKFSILVEAMKNDKCIKYSNVDRLGNEHNEKIALPLSIEYSVRDNKYRVSMHSIEENKPILASLSTLRDITILQEDYGINREEARSKLIQQKYCEKPVVLEIIDERAAMERCSMCFTGMERVSKVIDERKYEMQLNYYMFEEEALIRNIISMGPMVKVISPKRIQDQVIKRVKKAYLLSKKTF